MRYSPLRYQPPSHDPTPLTGSLKPLPPQKTPRENNRMAQAPSKFSTFSVSVANADGEEIVVLGSTCEPPVSHHTIFLGTLGARALAQQLIALADQLDPPPPWPRPPA